MLQCKVRSLCHLRNRATYSKHDAAKGTSDSTIPSPLHKKERRLEVVPVAHHISREEIIPTLNSNIHVRLRDPKGPPSPTTLAHRLAELSPRPSSSSFLSHRRFAPDPEEDNPGATDDGSESLLDDETPWEWGELQGNRKERNAPSAAIADTASSSRLRTDQDDDNRALQDAVRGLFWLWKAGPRQRSLAEGKGDKSTEELDRADFLHLVGRAIATPK